MNGSRKDPIEHEPSDSLLCNLGLLTDHQIRVSRREYPAPQVPLGPLLVHPPHIDRSDRHRLWAILVNRERHVVIQ